MCNERSRCSDSSISHYRGSDRALKPASHSAVGERHGGRVGLQKGGWGGEGPEEEKQEADVAASPPARDSGKVTLGNISILMFQ